MIADGSAVILTNPTFLNFALVFASSLNSPNYGYLVFGTGKVVI
ncbi:hypothetical protein STZ1_40034 [Bacillus subtilis]